MRGLMGRTGGWYLHVRSRARETDVHPGSSGPIVFGPVFGSLARRRADAYPGRIQAHDERFLEWRGGF